MNKKNKWFSLIEVIVASSILSISVFGVYKLIWENTKIINNSSNSVQLNYFFPIIEECIANIWFWNFSHTIWYEYDFNLWLNNNECSTWTLNKVNIDNIDYDIKWVIKDYQLNYIDWELSISSWLSNTLTWKYILLNN